MKIVIDADDAATDLKNIIVEHLNNNKDIELTDLKYIESHPGAPYPEVGYNLAQYLKDRSYDRGILMCGTGLGMAMIANKVESVFAGTCHNVYSAERLRKSNDAQIITMGSRVIGPDLAKTVIDAWLVSEFQGGRSTKKVEKMRELEQESFHPKNQ